MDIVGLRAKHIVNINEVVLADADEEFDEVNGIFVHLKNVMTAEIRSWWDILFL